MPIPQVLPIMPIRELRPQVLPIMPIRELRPSTNPNNANPGSSPSTNPNNSASPTGGTAGDSNGDLVPNPNLNLPRVPPSSFGPGGVAPTRDAIDGPRQLIGSVSELLQKPGFSETFSFSGIVHPRESRNIYLPA
jgi:hypothetical protein